MVDLKKCMKKTFWNSTVAFNLLYDILSICIFAILNITFLILKPYHMQIPMERENPNVIYPKEADIVPSSILYPVSFLTPMIVIIVFGCIRKSPRYTVFGLLALLLAIVINGTITNLGKIFAGRPRPSFYERQDAGDEIDTWKSFPSGHSSIAFVGLVYTSLLLAGQFKVFSKKGYQAWKILIVFVPWFVAAFIAVSRTRDYHHNFSDIIGGTLIGIFVAFLIYFSKYNGFDDEHPERMKIEDCDQEENEENEDVIDENKRLIDEENILEENNNKDEDEPIIQDDIPIVNDDEIPV